MANKPKKNSYESGYAKIKDEQRNNLGISVDSSGSSMTNLAERIVVLLFTPSMKDTSEHYHIDLDYEEAVKLKNFLQGYIDEVYAHKQK